MTQGMLLIIIIWKKGMKEGETESKEEERSINNDKDGFKQYMELFQIYSGLRGRGIHGHPDPVHLACLLCYILL